MESIDSRDEVAAAVALVSVAGLGPIRVARLREAFGSARDALAAGAADWSTVLGVAAVRAGAMRREALAEAASGRPAAEITVHAAIGGRPILPGSPEYPALLAAIPDPPPVLWVRGGFGPEDLVAVAVVGARRATPYGLEQAARFAAALAERGHPVVSGGARGVDASAHRAALRAGGRTIAVLGSGLGVPYPSEHAPLFDAIVAGGGAVVSEFACFTRPAREHFPRRNRILSGLSIGVVLVEAWARSGASITARLAVECHDRDAFAIPGRVDSAASEGCHAAIREGWAALIAGPEDLFRGLGESAPLVRAVGEAAPKIALDPESRRIGERLHAAGEALPEDLVPDEAIGRTLALLTCLEVQGLARRGSNGRFATTDLLGRLLSG